MRLTQVFTLLRKEWLGVIRDRKTIITLLMTTLLLYPAMFGAMGMVDKARKEKFDATKPKVVVAETSPAVEPFLAALRQSNQFEFVTPADPQAALGSQEADAILHLTSKGDNMLLGIDYDERYGSSKSAIEKLKVQAELYKAQTIASRLQAKGISPAVLEPIAVTTENISKDTGGQIGSFLPYILVLGLIAGSLNLGVELTAGEKERGTITTLLVTQLSRAEIALGKLLTTLGMAIFSVILNLIALLLGFLLMNRITGEEKSTVMFHMLSAGSVLELLLVMLPLGCMISAMIIFLGTYARNSKEGNMYNMPLFIVVMGLGFTSSGMDANVSLGLYAIPLLGPILTIKQVLLQTGNLAGVVVSMLTSLVYTVLLILPLVKLYEREEVLFRM